MPGATVTADPQGPSWYTWVAPNSPVCHWQVSVTQAIGQGL